MTKPVLFFDPESDDDWESSKFFELLRTAGVRVGGYEDLDNYFDDEITLSYVYENDCWE